MDRVFKKYMGNSFKNLMRTYSNERMDRDRAYRKGVLELVAMRKDAAKDVRPIVSASTDTAAA